MSPFFLITWRVLFPPFRQRPTKKYRLHNLSKSHIPPKNNMCPLLSLQYEQMIFVCVCIETNRGGMTKQQRTQKYALGKRSLQKRHKVETRRNRARHMIFTNYNPRPNIHDYNLSFRLLVVQTNLTKCP